MRTPIAHYDEAYEEWGASESVRIDPDSDGRGMSLSITPTWGSAAGEAEQLWSARDPSGLAGNDDFEAKSRPDAEIGYGLRAPQGVGLVTPYAGLAITDGANRTLRTGLRWNASQSATPDLEAIRQVARVSPAPEEEPQDVAHIGKTPTGPSSVTIQEGEDCFGRDGGQILRRASGGAAEPNDALHHIPVDRQPIPEHPWWFLSQWSSSAQSCSGEPSGDDIGVAGVIAPT